MGTPDFAVPALKKIDDTFGVCCVFTQPDKKVGRKQIITPPCVKIEAQKRNIRVYQPDTLKSDDVYELIKDISPDVVVVAAYGKIVPKRILDIPKYGCINIHASLLPKYRGAAPIQWSVINGDEYTGVTIMKMGEGIDTGDIIKQEKVKIGINDTAEDVFEKLSMLGSDMILDVLSDIENLSFTPQDESMATYAKMMDRSICDLDFTQSAYMVHKKICGLYSWPIAQTKIRSKRVKIYRSEISTMEGEPGTVLSVDPLVIGCSQGSVRILELQIEGKKRMDAGSFVLGHKIEVNEKIGG